LLNLEAPAKRDPIAILKKLGSVCIVYEPFNFRP